MRFAELAGRFALAISDHLAEFEERELRFLLAYLQHLNAETLEAHMSIGTVARKAGISQATAYRALSRLKAAGWLVCGDRHRIFLGPRFLTAVQAEPTGGGSLKLVSVNQPTSVEPGPVRTVETPAPLPESLRFTLPRKGVTEQRLVQLVTQHGEARVLSKAQELAASYPDDARIRASFMGLLVRACEQDWVFTAEAKAPAPAPIPAPVTLEAGIETPAADTPLVAIAPDGQRFEVVLANASCVKYRKPKVTASGRVLHEELVIPARHWHEGGWRLEAA